MFLRRRIELQELTPKIMLRRVSNEYRRGGGVGIGMNRPNSIELNQSSVVYLMKCNRYRLGILKRFIRGIQRLMSTAQKNVHEEGP
jgi:hypothetical protein